MRRALLATAVMVLAASLTRVAAAQEDWSPRYVPPGSTAQPVAQPPAPAPTPASASPASPAAPSAGSAAKDKELRQIAEQFAPIFRHAMAGGDAGRRFDYPTNFDFDSDWTGNNNWEHAADPQYKLWSFVYYSVVEGEDHYFIHYVMFHPRSWTVQAAGAGSIVEQIQQKMRQITGQGQATEPDHENDLEGVLVIVDKWAEGGPAAVAVETAGHGHLLAAIPPGAQGLTAAGASELRLEDGHPIVYVESQKHGMRPWKGEQAGDQESVVTWRYGKTMEASRLQGESGTYELVSLSKTLWARALNAQESGPTYGTVQDFGDFFCAAAGAQRPGCQMGVVGAALRGDYGVANAATAPWMWAEGDDADAPPGTWFFDPIVILIQHFGLSGEKEKYLYHPYLGIGAGSPPSR